MQYIKIMFILSTMFLIIGRVDNSVSTSFYVWQMIDKINCVKEGL